MRFKSGGHSSSAQPTSRSAGPTYGVGRSRNQSKQDQVTNWAAQLTAMIAANSKGAYDNMNQNASGATRNTTASVRPMA